MTHIASHTPHLPLVREAEKPATNLGHGQDFMDHLGDGERSLRPRGRSAPNNIFDGTQPTQIDDGCRTLNTCLQVTDPADGRASAGDIAAGTTETLLVNPQWQTARHIPIAVDSTDTRARVFEQHWFANGYLSFLAEAGAARAAHEHGRAVDMTIGSMPVTAATPQVSTHPELGPTTEMGMGNWLVAQEAQTSTTGAPLRSIERMVRTLGPLVAADQPWPERLLRLSQQPGGKTAVWVRDYKLAPQAIEPLVAHLRQLARREGIALERVVVNGTIVWHSESLKGEA